MAHLKRIFVFFVVFIALGSVLVIFLYTPYIKAFYKFVTSRKTGATVVRNSNALVGLRNTIVVNDENFGIVIPELGINSPIVANVSPYNDYEYKGAFKKGIAHSKGSSLPGKGGSIVLFANSPGGFFEVQKYNPAFYLLNKLKEGDPIYLYYKSSQYKYSVVSKEVLDVMNINFIDLKTDPKYENVYIMTVWPPGTSFLRYVVEAQKQKL